MLAAAYLDCESVSASERQDEEQMPRETGTREGRTPPTGDPHRGEDPAEDPPPEGRATQGTHTEHTQTPCDRLGKQSTAAARVQSIKQTVLLALVLEPVVLIIGTGTNKLVLLVCLELFSI